MQHTTLPIFAQAEELSEKITPSTRQMLFSMSALILANLLVCALLMAGLLILIS